MPRTIVVTGASAGLGRAVVRRLAVDGHRIGLLARGRAGLDAAAEEVRRAGGTALVLPCDVADAEAVERAAGRVEERLGPIDVWIGCAMTAVQASVLDTSADELRRVTEVTYLGAAHGIQAALRRMVPRDRGHVVQIGSALAVRGAPTQAGYVGAKHAILGFCDVASAELRAAGSAVTVTVLHPPAMNTTHFGWVRAHTRGEPRPFPPVAQPEAVAEQVAWALEHPRRSRIVVDLPTAFALSPLGRTDLPVLGPAVGALIARGLQRRTALRPRPDALLAPLDEHVDHGVRGPFGREVRERLPEAVMLRRPGAVAAVAAAAGLVAATRRPRPRTAGRATGRADRRAARRTGGRAAPRGDSGNAPTSRRGDSRFPFRVRWRQWLVRADRGSRRCSSS
jgi:short-subunit dehydrogenase